MLSSRPLKFWVEMVVPPIAFAAARRAKRHLTPESERELPARPLAELFPGIESAAVAIEAGQFERPPGTLPLAELLLLAAMTSHLQPRRAFEFGTFRGASTVVLAKHAPAEAEIYTLDLPPTDRRTALPLDNGNITGMEFTIGQYYLSSPYAGKVKQLYGDSAKFDVTPYANTMDFVFVDGNHAYDNVKVDSQHAFALLKPGGTILWDDYHPDFGPGVMRALHELRGRGLTRIAGSRFVVYRDQRA